MEREWADEDEKDQWLQARRDRWADGGQSSSEEGKGPARRPEGKGQKGKKGKGEGKKGPERRSDTEEKGQKGKGKARRGLKKGQPQKRKARREREKASRGLREGQKPKKKAREARKKRARRGMKEGQSLSLNTGKAGQSGTLFGKKGEAKGPERPERLKGPKGQMCKKGGKGACRKATLQTKFNPYSQGPKSGG